MIKTCLACGERLSGRIDKKYCNKACRNDFHNSRISSQTYIEKQVTSGIRKNRAILRDLTGKGVFEIPLSEIEFYGFTLKGITGFEEPEPGIISLHCYEFNILKTGDFLQIRQVV